MTDIKVQMISLLGTSDKYVTLPTGKLTNELGGPNVEFTASITL